ncbi:hypothetical protein LI156_25355 [Blautia producta]|jgi:hypothetical protein|uniref:hypothetical protein n=1 Tax=Blautia producta TaxID=33035 RepID=UPI001D08D1CD|nr:hypothetical protein [Blautia producta]MCB6785419.1 hypothetical protein [Blautia producta]DAP78036.1 MAG TPA: Iron-sulfur cluster-binding domain [Caudoviricetes sp.]
MDDRERQIADLQRYLDEWRRGWQRQHREQILKARAPEPCRDCPKAGVIDMHGKLIYGCNMGFCIIMDFSGGMK